VVITALVAVVRASCGGGQHERVKSLWSVVDMRG